MDAKKRNIVIALMVAMFLGAVEGTVVTNAIPTIVKDLNGFELISLVFSLYLLTSAISTPIYGKLSDLFGRKNILSIGIIIFLIGSSLCGFSRNMYELIAFRALQGLGAGSIFTVTYTIVGDVFTLSERGRVQGWLGTVWGIASLAGPSLGGFLIDVLSWHWIFFINLPFGILSIILLQRNMIENIERKKHKIDYLGTIILSAAIILILYTVMSAENNSGWNCRILGINLLIVIFLLISFYFIEKKAKEPIIPFEIFTKTNIIVNMISFLSASALIGINVYLPIYIQNVLGFGATVSGLVTAPMSIAWLLSSMIIAEAIPRYGERTVTLVSFIIMLTGCALLLTLGMNSPLVLIIIYSFFMGFGFGGGFTTLTIVVQASVDYNRRGAATASNSLVRTLAQTIGVSIFGSIFNLNIVKYFNSLGIKGIEPRNLYSSSTINSGVSLQQIKTSLNSGLHIVFAILVAISLISLVLSITLPNNLKEKNN